MSRKLTDEEGRRMVSRYDWKQLLIFSCDMGVRLPDAITEVEDWMADVEIDW